MKIYLTGTDHRDTLLDIQGKLESKGHSVTTPYDVVEGEWTENANLVARLQAVLSAEHIVTTPPTQGAWGLGAEREVKVAREANLPVSPAMTFLNPSANA